MYSSETEVWRLIEALDERGQREKALKTQLKARFPHIKEPQYSYLTEGSPYIGKFVKRQFNKRDRPTYGKIVSWLPKNEEKDDEPAIWHIQHVDGDEEGMKTNHSYNIYIYIYINLIITVYKSLLYRC